MLPTSSHAYGTGGPLPLNCRPPGLSVGWEEACLEQLLASMPQICGERLWRGVDPQGTPRSGNGFGLHLVVVSPAPALF